MATTQLPIKRDIVIKQGDSWRLPFIIKLPDLTAFGFTTHDLTGCVIKAQIRPGYQGEVRAEINGGIIDPAERTFRPWIAAEDTVGDIAGIWDLQIKESATGWTRTFYEGSVTLKRQVTHD